MRLRPLVRGMMATALVALSFSLACSRQSEGERCSRDNNDDDCNDGLVCVAGADLRSNDGVDRCCPPEGTAPDDDRCVRGGTGVGSGGTGGTGADAGGGTGGSAGEGPTDAGMDADADADATPCTHRSECPVGMICGPQGVCQIECLADRDCNGGEVCDDAGACVSGAGGSGS